VLINLREGQLQKIVLGLGASTDTGPVCRPSTPTPRASINWRAVTKAQLERDARFLNSELTSRPMSQLALGRIRSNQARVAGHA